jgi:thioredoxin reductase (NADPH)
MTASTHDIIIIGGGPAGLTAGIYTSRELLATLILEKTACGGWPSVTDRIENYPGFPEGITGPELAERMKGQAVRFGTEIREFIDVSAAASADGCFHVRSDQGEFAARALIVASGSRHKTLGIPGEREFLGKGVSYCGTCDGPLFRNKDVAVIGGGDTAFEEARFLSRFASRVYLVHRRDEFRGTKMLEEELRKSGKVIMVLNALPQAVQGSRTVESLAYRDKVSGEEKRIELSGVFIFVGQEPNSACVRGLVDLNEGGYVVTDGMMRSSRPGVFAAGDVRAGNVRQVAAAVGEGATAAIAARDYLNSEKAPR